MKITQKSKKIIIIAIIVVVAVAIIAASGVQTHKKNEAAKTAAQAKKLSKEYGENLNTAAYSMLSGASDADSNTVNCYNALKVYLEDE